MNRTDREKLHDEFGSHFKNSPDELRFLEVFISELITENYQKDLIRLNKALNKQCEDKVKEAFNEGEKSMARAVLRRIEKGLGVGHIELLCKSVIGEL